MDKKGVRKPVLIGLVVVVVVGLILAWGFPTLAGLSCAPAPEPYEALSEQYATTDDGDVIYISRAVVGREQGVEVDGRKAIALPSCWSWDESLITITNLDVTLTNGERVTVIVGVVGRERLPFESTPPPQ